MEKRRKREKNAQETKNHEKKHGHSLDRCIIAVATATAIAVTMSSCDEAGADITGKSGSSDGTTGFVDVVPSDISTKGTQNVPDGNGRITESPGEDKINTTNPTVTEPAVTEPAATEPAVTEPAVTEPAVTEPAVTEPAVTEPPKTEPPVENTDVVEENSYYEAIPYGTVYIDDPDMYDDETAVISEGSAGKYLVVIYTRYINGKYHSSWTERTEIKAPTDLIISVGTKESIRTEEKIITETVQKYSTIYEECDTMKEGTTAVKREGSDSVATRKYIFTYTHDILTSSELVSEDITDCVNEIILVGTMREEEEDDGTFGLPFIDAAHGGKDYSITQCYGGSNNHLGIDFAVYYGDPIVASMGGTVIAAYDEGYFSHDNILWTYGTYVVIEHDGYRTYYAHLSSRTVSVGDTVKKGDIIGSSGNTGRVSSSGGGIYAGTHLHFEIRKYYPSLGIYHTVDPLIYLPW